MINESNRIQFERGVIEYAQVFVFESDRKKFLNTATSSLKDYIDKYSNLPYSLLVFCGEIQRKTYLD